MYVRERNSGHVYDPNGVSYGTTFPIEIGGNGEDSFPSSEADKWEAPNAVLIQTTVDTKDSDDPSFTGVVSRITNLQEPHKKDGLRPRRAIATAQLESAGIVGAGGQAVVAGVAPPRHRITAQRAQMKAHDAQGFGKHNPLVLRMVRPRRSSRRELSC